MFSWISIYIVLCWNIQDKTKFTKVTQEKKKKATLT